MKTIGIVAGLGQLPVLGARAARGRGWDVVVVSVSGDHRAELAAEAASYHDIALGEYGRIVAAFTERGVRDVYVLGKLPKTIIYSGAVDEAASRVLLELPERGDHAVIEAFLRDMGRRGLTVCSQLDLLHRYIVPSGFVAGRQPSPEQWQDVAYGRKVARWLTDRIDAGQTVVVKNRVVLALEAAEGTDATIRRGGGLGGAGTVVVKVKGSRTDPHDLPVIGLTTLASMEDVGAAVLAVEAERTLLLDREAVVARAREAGISFVAVEGNEDE